MPVAKLEVSRLGKLRKNVFIKDRVMSMHQVKGYPELVKCFPRNFPGFMKAIGSKLTTKRSFVRYFLIPLYDSNLVDSFDVRRQAAMNTKYDLINDL